MIAEGGGGWTLAIHQGLFAPAENTCAEAGGITAWLDAENPRSANDRIEWHFVAPPATRIAAYWLTSGGEVGPIDAGGAGGDTAQPAIPTTASATT